MSNPQRPVPWYQRVRRWGQTNITEADAADYDLDFWRAQWGRTRVQGVIINAGGIVAYYPSKFPLQYQAEGLNGRDLFGEVSAVAREEGLAVLARMDSNRATEAFHRAHPDWFAIDAAGQPYRAQDRYTTCINSPYYREYLPQVLVEIIDRYHPEGFTDNSWSGLGRDSICYCEHCADKFGEATGQALPSAKNWDDPVYQQWIEWSYACRLEIWDLNNTTTRQRGGEECLWLGMVNGEPVGQSRALRDLYEIGRRSRIMMCDHQSRDRHNGFEQNGLNGKLLHETCGWDKLIPESMAMYARGERPFRISANPPEEARTWMVEGMAGGISPWWHHIAARHEDRRQYHTAEPLMRWHEENESYLYDRQPLATVGVVWSRRNIDYYGRDEAEERVALPIRGWTMALTRARIPYLPIHAERIGSFNELPVLVLPDLAAVSDEQCAALRDFVDRGGALVASGNSSLMNEHGERRDDFALAEMLGVNAAERAPVAADTASQSWETHSSHTYLRLVPELAAGQSGKRHASLNGFDETDLLPFGGQLVGVRARARAQVLATYVPPFPIYPPEFCWMRTPRTDLPGIIAREGDAAGRGRVAYLAADIDRCFGRSRLPDHGDLLANLVRWATAGRECLSVQGPGYIDCHLYHQGDRLILHLVNLTHTRAWPGYVEEHVPVGPLEVAIRLDKLTASPSHAMLRVGGRDIPLKVADGWVRCSVPSVAQHEMVVIE